MDSDTIFKLEAEEKRFGYRGKSARKKLSKIADEFHYEGRCFETSGVERDDILKILAGRGASSFKEYMYGK